MFEFKLPDLGEGIHEGEVLKWYVKVGEDIKEDEPLMDVETDKAAVTIPSPRGGRVSKLNGDVGEVVHVGDVVAVISEGGEAVAPSDTTPKQEKKDEPVVTAPAMQQQPASTGGNGKTTSVPPPEYGGRPVPAAPATRRLAREMGVDLRLVSPSGPGGRVTPDDVRVFASGDQQTTASGAEGVTSQETESKEVAETVNFEAGSSNIPFLELEPLPDFSLEGPVETEAVRSIRRKIAKKMVTSMVLVPHVAHMDDADVTNIEKFRKEAKQSRAGMKGEKLTLLPFVMKAVIAAMREFPSFNASLDPFKQEIIYKKYYNLGFAADTPRGLVVPVVKGADKKNILTISDEIRDLAISAREGTLDVAAMREGTFTITNVGPLGGKNLIPTINYPEVAILGMGRVEERPVVRNGEIVIRSILPLSMAFDHRIADGADAARFVTMVIHLLSDPKNLLLEA
ncbi:2-oxo acid dehydrogenase subunit E2 [bacterium]|nr:2-oxo acid dehydrogenase subunit E2 [bacterium]